MTLTRDEKLNTILIGLGDRLKSFRIEKGFRQKDFAVICGIKQNNLSEIEHGKRGVTDTTLYNLINYFSDFDPIYILTGKKKEEERAVTEGVSEEG